MAHGLTVYLLYEVRSEKIWTEVSRVNTVYTKSYTNRARLGQKPANRIYGKGFSLIFLLLELDVVGNGKGFPQGISHGKTIQ
jgi:hypothetical protein